VFEKAASMIQKFILLVDLIIFDVDEFMCICSVVTFHYASH
jgi:hypothetical protein